MDKPYTTYQEQVDILKNKGLTVKNDSEVISLLKRYGYYGLITGYKQPFKLKDGNYKPHTTINDIYVLYEFDTILRELFLRHILVIETHIKSLLSYTFCQKYGDLESDYLNVNNYQYQAMQKEVTVLISKLQNTLNTADKHPYLLFQKTEHGNVPLWVLTRALTLGIVSKMFSLLHSDAQTPISKEFDYVSENALSHMLFLLTKVRNVCAHNERLYDFKDSDNEIHLTEVHRNLGLKTHNGDYIQGRHDLFAAVISFKYLLPDTEFSSFMNELESTIDQLMSGTRILQLSQIQKLMGFPNNWKDIRSCPKHILPKTPEDK